MITPEQIRAGRALINAKQSDLAIRAGVSLATLNNIERSIAHPRGKTLTVIANALQEEGIEISNDSFGVGVRLRAYERARFSDSRRAVENIVNILKRKSINPIERCVLCLPVDSEPHFYVWLDYGVRHIIFDTCAFTADNINNAQDLAGLILAFKSANIKIDIIKQAPNIKGIMAIDGVKILLRSETSPYNKLSDVLAYLPNSSEVLKQVIRIPKHLLNHLLEN